MTEADGLSRRQLVGASGAAGAAALLAGCGVLPSSAGSLEKLARTIKGSDVPILEGLLRIEFRLAYAYSASFPRLGGYGVRLDRWFLGHELEHIGAVSTLLKSGGVKPNESAGTFSLGHPRNATDVLMTLQRLEAGAVRAYSEAASKLSNGRLRAVAAAIMANEGQHLSIVRRGLGLNPVPAAILTGSE